MNEHTHMKVLSHGEDSVVQQPQYARIEEIQRLFGLAKGTVYNLLRTGRIRGCSLRVKGKKSRLRLIDVSSVKALIEDEINKQNKETAI
jgi:transposase